MILVSVAIFYGRNIVTPVLTVYFKDVIKLSYSQVGYLYSLYLFVMFATDIFTGGIADKYGRRRTLVLGLIFYGVSMFLISLSKGFAFCVFAYALAAVGSSLISGTLRAWYFTEVEKQNMAREEAKNAFGLLKSINSAGSLVIGLVNSVIIAYLGMRSVFYAAAVLNLLAALLALLLLPENWGDKKKNVLAIVIEG
ncbi:MFS transporter [Thermococcus piezophilus]|nr:MFS transporter [Thermococcus piezophilus]